MASVDDVQPVETMWLSPRKPNRIEISLASVPIVAGGNRVDAALLDACPRSRGGTALR